MHPPIEWLPSYKTAQLFTADECAHILALTKAKGFYPATRLDAVGRSVVDTNYRRCDSTIFGPAEALYQLIANRVFERLDDINANYDFDLYRDDLKKLIPKIDINRYEASRKGFIGPHTDVGSYVGTDNRKLSLSILLNDGDSFKGGDLTLMDGMPHRPLLNQPAGTVAVFPSFTLHEVEEVTEGVRHACVVWLCGPRLK